MAMPNWFDITLTTAAFTVSAVAITLDPSPAFEGTGALGLPAAIAAAASGAWGSAPELHRWLRASVEMPYVSGWQQHARFERS